MERKQLPTMNLDRLGVPISCLYMGGSVQSIDAQSPSLLCSLMSQNAGGVVGE